MSELASEPLLRWIPLLPLISAIVHGLLLGIARRPLSRGSVIAISCGTPLLSFLLACLAFANLIELPESQRFLLDTVYTWIGAGIGTASFSADLAFQLDGLSAVMALIVTGVGSAIHIYSVGYMEHDERDDRGFQRFFCYMNLSLAAMLVLVLADNLLLMFLGWEGVGLCAYLLIGFWYTDAENAYAGSKAFIANRIGDFGFLVGIMLLFWSLSEAGTPTISFRGIEAAFGEIAQKTLTLPVWVGGRDVLLVDVIGLCLFFGACGKSAQLPLHVWLPDSMAGPTPVSALIHAAAMVTAGVFLVCRMSFLYSAAPAASAVIAWVGGLTALIAATIAINQSDIKKVLAYSTMSQLGFMFVAAGCGVYTAAMFLLVTHAFFKTLLFLGAGAVILALHHEQDMSHMGALRKRLPKTRVVMLVGVLAIAGVPGLAGFFSQHEILVAAYASDVPGHMALYRMGVVTALLTSFYMFRMYFLVFGGESRVEREVRAHLREPGNVVLNPLYALAALSVLGGYTGLPQFWGDMIGIENSDSVGNFVRTVVATGSGHAIKASTEWRLVLIAVAACALGAASAWWLFARNPAVVEHVAASVPTFGEIVRRGYFVDALYGAVIVRPLVAFSDRVLHRGIDTWLIDGLAVNGAAKSIWLLAQKALKPPHSGMTQGYLCTVVAGLLGILLYLVR